MKYCLKCGWIWSDSSQCKNYEYCTTCGNTHIADDGVTSEQYEIFSEEQKDEYEKKIQETVKHSPYFNERLFEKYSYPPDPDYYYAFRYDKYCELTGESRAGQALTPEEEIKQQAEFEEQMRQAEVHYYIQAARDKEMAERDKNKPKCPTCGSTNIKKMSGIERGASIAAFGIFSKKINKTFKCCNCGYTW